MNNVLSWTHLTPFKKPKVTFQISRNKTRQEKMEKLVLLVLLSSSLFKYGFDRVWFNDINLIIKIEKMRLISGLVEKTTANMWEGTFS